MYDAAEVASTPAVNLGDVHLNLPANVTSLLDRVSNSR